MHLKWMMGAAAAALVLGGVGFEIATTDNEKAPFLGPLALADAICGKGDEIGSRRAFFLRAAAAYAAAQTTETSIEGAMTAGQLANIGWQISSDSAEAQQRFNDGVAHMWNFNHAEAVNAFKAAQAADPECGVCFWAEAFALGPNINAPMEAEANEPAYAAAQKALSLRDGANERERSLINAIAYRYEPAPLDDRMKLDNAFADAMRDAAAAHPDDDFIAVVAAEANMDTQPWDYWEADKRTPKGRTAETLSLIEAVLARNPNYHAAIHLYIHMTEASTNPYRAASYADALGELSPGLGHLIHMPSHVYYRIGRFKDSLRVNIDAVDADEAFINGNDASPFYEFGYFTHNVHFALTSAHMAGDGETALAMAKKLDAKMPVEMVTIIPFMQPIKAAPYYAMAQFGDKEEILALEDPGADIPFLQAAWRYARGEAFARAGDSDAARAEAEAIGAILADTDFTPLVEGNVPAPGILDIARLVVIGRAAMMEEDFGTAIEAFDEAAAIQSTLNYMEPPYWYYPVKQSLGAALLKAGENERAEQLFIETLAENPNNGWVLYGLSEAYSDRGDKNGAKYAKGLMKDVWAGDKKSLILDHL